MTGKGSRRRPSSVPREVFDANWDQAFGPAKRDERRLTRDVVKVGEHSIRVIGVPGVPVDRVVLVTDDALRESGARQQKGKR